MTLGEIVKKYREDNSLSMDAFAQRCSLSKGYISMLENNINARNNKPIAPTITSMNKIAIGMGIEIDKLFELMDSTQLVSLADEKATSSKGVKIKVLGRVAAGIPIEAIEDIINTEEITEEMARTGKFFGLQIKGDSMTPNICNGDIVIVRQQDDAENGDVVIATVNGSDAVCKRLRKYKEGIELISNNPSYEPMEFSNNDILETPVKIIGKVVELRRKF